MKTSTYVKDIVSSEDSEVWLVLAVLLMRRIWLKKQVKTFLFFSSGNIKVNDQTTYHDGVSLC